MGNLDQMPKWAQTLSQAMVECIEFKGPASIELWYSPAGENGWGIDLIELFPASMEIEEAGPLDGEQVYGIVHVFDLLKAQSALNQVDALTFGIDNEGQPEIALEGEFQGHKVVVLVKFEPIADAEEDE